MNMVEYWQRTDYEYDLGDTQNPAGQSWVPCSS